jgi:hypothetical protein
VVKRKKVKRMVVFNLQMMKMDKIWTVIGEMIWKLNSKRKIKRRRRTIRKMRTVKTRMNKFQELKMELLPMEKMSLTKLSQQ